MSLRVYMIIIMNLTFTENRRTCVSGKCFNSKTMFYQSVYISVICQNICVQISIPPYITNWYTEFCALSLLWQINLCPSYLLLFFYGYILTFPWSKIVKDCHLFHVCESSNTQRSWFVCLSWHWRLTKL